MHATAYFNIWLKRVPVRAASRPKILKKNHGQGSSWDYSILKQTNKTSTLDYFQILIFQIICLLVLTACKWRFAFTEYIPKFKTYIHTISLIFRSPGTLFKYSRSIPDCCSLKSWPAILIVFHTTPTRNITYSYYNVSTNLSLVQSSTWGHLGTEVSQL